MIYKILQIKNRRECNYTWMSWEIAEKDFNINDYEVIYKGNIEKEDLNQVVQIEDYLEHLFYVFNMQHPVDFKGHSLSVSDIIELDNDLYYVDSFGFKKIEE